jgi:hypothetical protein
MVWTASAHRTALRAVAVPLRETATRRRPKHMNFHKKADLKKIRVERGTSVETLKKKKVCQVALTDPPSNQRLAMYMVISKPKRMSLAAGVCHFMWFLLVGRR